MWPLERKLDVLRVGRVHAEYWSRAPDGLVLQARHSLGAQPGEPKTLEVGLRNWLLGLESASSRANPVDVVVESAWLPIMLIEVGRSKWRGDHMERLLRHRTTELHLQPGATTEDWSLQLDHRQGEPQALGYALAPETQRALVGAVLAAGRRPASLQPALAWARRRFERRERRLRTCWWIWCEQDRAIVCRMERGRVTAMNAGAAVPGDEAQHARLVAIEAARCGFTEVGEPVVLASWEKLAALREEDPARPAPRALRATT
ncbi:hypothetical protein ACG04R_23320 [Roseateles sp. BYS78W]|uniref:Uncharacterized protein n=1 Tax=Pelomonas candidula TaxID=3299025 RepID=A0ABW7HIA1_9BURK